MVWKLEVRFTEKVREEGEGLLGEEEEEEEIGQKVRKNREIEKIERN